VSSITEEMARLRDHVRAGNCPDCGASEWIRNEDKNPSKVMTCAACGQAWYLDLNDTAWSELEAA
jgi:predicted RNA-binding Zn-ribbon protein involved in translation (DUF1610 family)